MDQKTGTCGISLGEKWKLIVITVQQLTSLTQKYFTRSNHQPAISCSKCRQNNIQISINK